MFTSLKPSKMACTVCGVKMDRRYVHSMQKCDECKKKLYKQARKERKLSIQVKHRSLLKKLKDECMTAYGGKCSKCGESRSACLLLTTMKKGYSTRETLTLEEFRYLSARKYEDPYTIICLNCWAAREK